MTEHVDGNVLAGPLSELFRDDITTATGRCAHCGDIAVLAEALVYDAAPGWCVRCHVCGEVLMTFVRAEDGRLRIDLRGVSALEVGRARESSESPNAVMNCGDRSLIGQEPPPEQRDDRA